MASVNSSLSGTGGGLITHTSQLINDGEFPNDDSKFVESNEIFDIVQTIIVGDGLADKNFVEEIFTPSKIWKVKHDLKKIVSVTTTDTAGTTMEGQITINDGENVTVVFNMAVTGYISLN